MTTSERSGRRGQLLAAVSVLGVSLGMAAPALARDPTAVENPTTTGQNTQKGTQTSIKTEQNTQKIVPQTSIKGTVDQTSWKTPAVSGQVSQKGGTSVPGGAAPSP